MLVVEQETELKKLENRMHVKVDEFPESPLECQKFGWALFEMCRFTRMTLESYSAESKRFGANIKRKNRKLRKSGNTISVYSAKSDTMAAVTIPNFYYLCQVAIWAILEEFLRDALFITITENITGSKKRTKGIRQFNIPKEELVGLVIEGRRNNVDELNRIYKKILNIDLCSNKKMSDLFKMRERRNVTAHSGILFGYNSLTKKKEKMETFEKELNSMTYGAGMEFINAKPIVNEKGEEKLPDSWYSYDPTTTKSSHRFEQDFCDMVELVWELGYYVSKKLFIERKTR